MRGRLGVWLLVSLGVMTVTAPLPDSPAVQAGAPSSVGLLYITHGGHGSGTPWVGAYSIYSSGAATPLLTVGGQSSGMVTPRGLAFDQAGSLYVQNFLGIPNLTQVFAPGASGDVAPTRSFGDNHRDAQAIAIDAGGFVYVAFDNIPPGEVDVFPPTATGFTNPMRTIVPDALGQSRIMDLAIDNHGNLVVGLVSMAGNFIDVFAPGASGTFTPGPSPSPQPTGLLRQIRGPNTSLGAGTCCDGDNLLMAYSPATDEIYAGVSACFNPTLPTHISAFPDSSAGNVAPVRAIAGPATGLGSGRYLAGLAAQPQDGSVFALVSTNCSTLAGPSQVEVFAPTASGNAGPGRSFTDVTDDLVASSGMAFGPMPAPGSPACGIPPAVSVTAAGPGSATVHWAPSGRCDAFAVYAYSPTAPAQIMVTANPSALTINGLVPGSYYAFTVIGYGGGRWVGWAPWSGWLLA